VTFTGTETHSRPLQAVPLTTRLPKVPPATSFAPAIVSSPIGPDNRILASRSHSIRVRLPRYSIPISPYCLKTQCCTNLQHRRYLFSGRTRYVLPFLLNHFYLSPERPSSTGTLSHQLCITQRSPECAKKKATGTQTCVPAASASSSSPLTRCLPRRRSMPHNIDGRWSTKVRGYGVRQGKGSKESRRRGGKTGA
jgi:hypothetical protein